MSRLLQPVAPSPWSKSWTRIFCPIDRKEAPFDFDVDEVKILRRGDEIILRKKPANLKAAFDLLAGMPEDFFAEGRTDPLPEMRETI